MAVILRAARGRRFSIPDRSCNLFRHAGGHPRRRARPLAPIDAGRHTDQLAEASAEGANRRAADRKTDLRDAEIATTQQRHRALDAPRHEVAVGRLAEGAPELAAEVPGRHVRAAGQRLDVQRLGVLPVDPVADAAQLREVAQVLRRRGSAGHLRDDATSCRGHLARDRTRRVTRPEPRLLWGSSSDSPALSATAGRARMISRSGFVTLTIRLLGPPAIERDGRPAPPPRGRKAWALLAYLLVAERPPGRRQLAELLFGDADDPLGTLRWTLAELRRALGQPGLFGGDPVATAVGPDMEVDLQAVGAEPAEPAALLELGGELLEGMSVASSPAFESWLVVERHRVSAVVEARLRQAAMTLLASGRAEAAVAYASRAVARNPLDEGNHELLLRSLATAGDRAAAARQVAVATDTLRR